MKTFREFVTESDNALMRRLRGSSAILPSRSKLNPKAPHKNEYHADWQRSGSEGTYLNLKRGDKHIILSGSGKPSNYPEVGSTIKAHHDQTFKDLGHWEVTHKVSHSEAHKLPHHAPLYVYKTMANDLIAVMQSLGHRRFAVEKKR